VEAPDGQNGWLKLIETGVEVVVRATPNAHADQIDGQGVDSAGRAYLKVRVRAVPDKGLANKAVCQVLAKALGVPKSSVAIVKGSTDRLKTVRIAGNRSALRAALLEATSSQPEHP
jgi:uncharacterized protein